ncbi:glycoside hydrolase family 1 protein [Lacticaseibacillus hegangensis]|uniref:Glycoside hydrolase family 1 protein n=1 Tax=Lacticaseibacillus hegangensis TaxID=2486010 RepID=A0ABW4D0P4_9LACO|nr:glycoside hydrolase family 1 protein [Lacticaseibacillus hegangensis]
MQIRQIAPFPQDFLWGASSSSFQAEGAWHEGGKGDSVISHTETEAQTTAFDEGVDFYHQYHTDIGLMKEAGLKAFRFSIAWTRIFPQGVGKPNPEGVAFYHHVIDELSAASIEPIVTMYHFDYPQHLVDKYGGWLSRRSINDFVTYAKFLLDEYGDKVHYWITINEQDHITKMPYRLGILGKTYSESMREEYQANHHMVVASAKVFNLIHTKYPGTEVGPALSYQVYYPATHSPEDTEAAMDLSLLTQDYLLELQCSGRYDPVFRHYLESHNAWPDFPDSDLDYIKANSPDFIGVNYYSSDTVAYMPANGDDGEIGGKPVPSYERGIYQKVRNKELPTTQWGWTIDPRGLKLSLRKLYYEYHLPMIVTENGFSEEEEVSPNKPIDDTKRIAYLGDHIRAVQEAISLGIPVFGYCIWSFTDVISGHSGMNKRYGIVAVNRTNFDLKAMNRLPKKSFYWYQQLIKKGAY